MCGVPFFAILIFIQFRGVKKDNCHQEGESTVKKIKFTTCVDNQFTCNDGECIHIDQR